MLEVHESERDAFDPLGEVVDGFGRAVGDVRLVPRDDLGGPAGDGAPETSNLDWHLAVGEITSDFGDSLGGELDVGVVVDLTDDLFCVPRKPHFSAWVTGS